MDEIGNRIKQLRKDKNITVTALAKEANITRSLISQIESGYTYPSLKTLANIVKALDISMSDFFKVNIAGEDENDFVVRADQRQSLYLPDAKNAYYLLAKTIYQNIEFLLADYPPHSDNLDASEAFTHDGMEFFFMAEGRLNLTVDGKTSVINKGDSGCFDSRLKHSYVNRSDANAQIVVFYIGNM